MTTALSKILKRKVSNERVQILRLANCRLQTGRSTLWINTEPSSSLRYPLWNLVWIYLRSTTEGKMVARKSDGWPMLNHSFPCPGYFWRQGLWHPASGRQLPLLQCNRRLRFWFNQRTVWQWKTLLRKQSRTVPRNPLAKNRKARTL